MARHLLRRGVTVVPADGRDRAARRSSPRSPRRVRAWLPDAPADGAEPLGFNLEGPFLADGAARRPRPGPSSEPRPTSPRADLEPLLDGLRLITIAPELPGAARAHRLARASAASPSRSATRRRPSTRRGPATRPARTSTTHLFNAMSGIDHRAPGLAARRAPRRRGLRRADRRRHPRRSARCGRSSRRLKPADRLLLVSDAIALAGMGDGRARSAGSRSRSSGRGTLGARRRWPGR